MQISERGLDFIKNLEGYKDTSYRDEAGVWTIGYGTTWIDGKRVTSNMTCTRGQAAMWLLKDVADEQEAVNQLVKVHLEQYQFDALVSLVYNIGRTGFKNSTLLRELNAGHKIYLDYFERWKMVTDPVTKKRRVSNGLINRRRREFKLFDKGIMELN